MESLVKKITAKLKQSNLHFRIVQAIRNDCLLTAAAKIMNDHEK